MRPKIKVYLLVACVCVCVCERVCVCVCACERVCVCLCIAETACVRELILMLVLGRHECVRGEFYININKLVFSKSVSQG